jgi:hypothetical protein
LATSKGEREEEAVLAGPLVESVTGLMSLAMARGEKRRKGEGVLRVVLMQRCGTVQEAVPGEATYLSVRAVGRERGEKDILEVGGQEC